MPGPLLSLCLIAKDEETSLGRCLESVRGVVDELVVVDTGSRDRTAEIARAAGARLETFPWADDFAAARNFSLSLATGEWVLILDADEELEVADPVGFRSWLGEATDDLYQVELLNLTSSLPDKAGTRELLTRMFRRAAGFTYTGAVHEQLTGAGPVRPTQAPFLRILHHGYRPEVMVQKEKLQRNLALLQKAVQEAPDDPYLNYQLGSALFQTGDHAGAWSAFATALKHAAESALLLRDAGYCLKALGRVDEALALVDRGLSLHPAYTDLTFLRGLLLLDAGRASEAAQAFLQCLNLGEAPLPYSSRIGVGSFLAAFNLGVIFETLGDLERAAEDYRLALSFNPAFAPARSRLAAILASK